uniref:Uncharacterized protein n=1 Tax=Timema shepardi TaxID=629360 RepID=A0A7R9B8R1_TIMSH|nr:unnamed protein product [Timema shepardi]
MGAELNKSTPRRWQRTSTGKALEMYCVDFPPDSPVFKTPNIHGRKYKSDSKTERNAHNLTTHTPVKCDGHHPTGYSPVNKQRQSTSSFPIFPFIPTSPLISITLVFSWTASTQRGYRRRWLEREEYYMGGLAPQAERGEEDQQLPPRCSLARCCCTTRRLADATVPGFIREEELQVIHLNADIALRMFGAHMHSSL